MFDRAKPFPCRERDVLVGDVVLQIDKGLPARLRDVPERVHRVMLVAGAVTQHSLRPAAGARRGAGPQNSSVAQGLGESPMAGRCTSNGHAVRQFAGQERGLWLRPCRF